MRKLKGSFWKCTDPDYDMFGRYCVVKDGELTAEWNGDNDIEVMYADGSRAYMKLRRFLSRHQAVLPRRK